MSIATQRLGSEKDSLYCPLCKSRIVLMYIYEDHKTEKRIAFCTWRECRFSICYENNPEPEGSIRR